MKTILLGLLVIAQVTIPVQIVDFFIKPVKVNIYQNSKSVLTIQLQNYGIIVNGTNNTPYFYIARSATNKSVNGLCVWQNQTASVFTVTFTSNNLPKNGKWIYGCGLSNQTGITTFNQGLVDILPDPWR